MLTAGGRATRSGDLAKCATEADAEAGAGIQVAGIQVANLLAWGWRPVVYPKHSATNRAIPALPPVHKQNLCRSRHERGIAVTVVLADSDRSLDQSRPICASTAPKQNELGVENQGRRLPLSEYQSCLHFCPRPYGPLNRNPDKNRSETHPRLP